MVDPNNFSDATLDSDSRQKSSGNPLLWVVLGISGCGCFVLLLGVVAAILLPSFISQADRARETEGEQYVSAFMRAQQAYMLENGQFTESIEQLQLGIPNESEFYRYQMRPRADQVEIVGIAKEEGLKSYSATVFVREDGQMLTRVCETIEPSLSPPEPAVLNPDGYTLDCPPGSQAS